MVKLDATILQYLEKEDFRVLAALELAIRNHDLVPSPLIERIANLPRGGALKRLKEMLKYKLIHHDRQFYDGYAMKYAAYDFLALHTFAQRGVLSGIGSMMGCGKESDIYLCTDKDGQDLVIKLERLGRCSFRTVAKNRNYTKNGRRGGASWYYLSRLAATKEFAFLQTLYEEGYPVPRPVDHNRHAIVMERVDGEVLYNARTLQDPTRAFYQCIDLIVRLAQNGFIHGDFNEFNLLLRRDTEELVLIDFPQMVSVRHKNAVELFNRDIQCIHHFFLRKYKLSFDYWPKLDIDGSRIGYLDSLVLKGKFTKQDEEEMEKLISQQKSLEDSLEQSSSDTESACGSLDGDSSCDDDLISNSSCFRDSNLMEQASKTDSYDRSVKNCRSFSDCINADPSSERKIQNSSLKYESTSDCSGDIASEFLARPHFSNLKVDTKHIRQKVAQEGERRAFGEFKGRLARRNLFKSRDKRRLNGELSKFL
mmetsp:Transcript_1773/g.2418  ORF Transcript_1773/g.2418 Transcript_1773/m.2418 type:complete len:480 (-) Transcript_1773:14-1453(-)